jgi:hypothetical protein
VEKERQMNRGAIFITRDRLVSAIREWREEWDSTPNQFLINESFRQSDPKVYAQEVADHLWTKLMQRHDKGGPRS